MYVTTHRSPIGLGAWLGEQPAPQINWCQMRQTIATTVRGEFARWTAPNGQQFLENHPSRLPVLREYWAAVPVGNPAAASVQSAANNLNFPWSAAFICFVMRRSGVLPAHGFVFGQRHIIFIVGALRNREQSIRNFHLVDATELQRGEATPEPGDLLCFNRCVSGRPTDVCGGVPRLVRTTHTYESLRRRFWQLDPNVVPTGSAHTAIVVDTPQIGGQRFVETIGGNEGDSVRITRFPLDQNGHIANPQDNHIFGMIKIVGCR